MVFPKNVWRDVLLYEHDIFYFEIEKIDDLYYVFMNGLDEGETFELLDEAKKYAETVCNAFSNIEEFKEIEEKIKNCHKKEIK